MAKNHPKVNYGKTGILIINLGTPEKLSYWSIRKYLKEFLSDKRVIEVPQIIWQVILNLFILTFRPKKCLHSYGLVWRKKENLSPLAYYTKKQAEKLQKKFKNEKNIIFDWAMRYGKPAINDKIIELRKQGCTKITIFPLYPQYSATTTATVCDEVFRSLMKMRFQPSVKIIPPYHDHPAYIKALAKSIIDHKKKFKWLPEKLVISFHGLPKRYFNKGDPYYCYCQKTARLLKEELKAKKIFKADDVLTCFQSRFGPDKWLEPYTDISISQLAKDGVKNMLVITPGFSSDCLETLEEIAIVVKEDFIENGGNNFSVVPCLNDSEDHIKMLSQIIKEN